MEGYINRIRESGRALRQLIEVSKHNATTGVRPPLLRLVAVRAMAPVAGMPPKSGEALLATP